MTLRDRVLKYLDPREAGQALRAGVCIVVFALAVRAVVAFTFTFLNWKNLDTEGYLIQARTLLEGGFYDFFPNGFPALIALVWSVPGLEGTHWPLQLLNVLMSAATVGLIYYTAWRWKQNWLLAAGAALVLALWPNHLRYVRRVLSDLPATFLLVSTVVCLLRRRYAMSGVFAGFAAVMRPVIIPVWLGLVAITYFAQRKPRVALSVLTGLVPIGALLALAYVHTGQITMGGNLGYNLFKSIGVYKGEWWFSQAPVPPDATIIALEAYLGLAVERPGEFLLFRLEALWQMWGPWLFDSSRSVVSRFCLSLRLPLLALGAVGFWRCRRDPIAWLLAWPIISLTAIHMVFFGRPRFALPAEPFVILFAAIGAWKIAQERGWLSSTWLERSNA